MCSYEQLLLVPTIHYGEYSVRKGVYRQVLYKEPLVMSGTRVQGEYVVLVLLNQLTHEQDYSLQLDVVVGLSTH
jgi:hypothetical protein